MHRAQTIPQIRRLVSEWKGQGHRVAVVPTMGHLHAGHLALVQEARRRCPRVVATIFVNPTQFGAGEDYEAYPRDLESDAAALEDVGTDAVFVPEVGELYPRPLAESTQVRVPELSECLCGAFGPVHFAGVTTVVSKLFNIVQPDVAVFGEKDFQQLTIIRCMVRDLAFPVEIVGVATVREPDGLALSSRNSYLDPEERAVAPTLNHTLHAVAAALREGNQDLAALAHGAQDRLRLAGFRPDYVSIRRRADLTEAEPDDRELVILAAAWLGKARLIDNVTLDL